MTISTVKKFALTSVTVTGAALTVPMIADAALENQVLRYGQQSEDVRHLQTLLKEKGYFTYQTATGYYGDVTVRAVRQFQGDHSLSVDGIAGPQTIGALLKDRPSEQVRSSQSTSGGSSGTLIRTGMKGESVSNLQRQLRDLGFFNSTVDGHFGRVTQAAVQDFQRSHGLGVDGIVGPQTQRQLQVVQGSESVLGSGGGNSSSGDSGSSAPSSTGLISPGDRGNQVSILQQQLKDLGYYSHAVTGVFGPVTERAVRDFQRTNQIGADGLVGPQTHRTLASSPKRAGDSVTTTPSAPSGGNGIVRQGMQGQQVTNLQQLLRDKGYMNIAPTGVFGDLTYQAVRKFQQDHSLAVDGIAGPATFGALQGNTSAPSKPSTPPSSGGGSGGNFVTNVVNSASNHLGVPYVWGGTSPSGFDCSGFIQYVFKENGVNTPRTVANMYSSGTNVSSPSVGDIVFFDTTGGPSHAGIYIGNNKFVHAGSSTGVTVADLNNSYWNPRYLGAKRLH